MKLLAEEEYFFRNRRHLFGGLKKSLLIFMLPVILAIQFSSSTSAQQIYEEQTITFLLGKQTIVGTFTKPSGAQLFPVVLMLHGMSGNRHGPNGLFAHTARQWAAGGVASLRISTMGRGGSEGNFLDMTLDRRTQEALAAIDWILQRNDLDSTKISVLGHSQGTLIAVSLASRLVDANTVKSVILWAPQTNARATYRTAMGLAIFQKGLNADPDEVVSWRGVGGRMRSFKSGFFNGLAKINTLAEIEKYHGRLLIVTGARDRWSTASNAEILGKHHHGEHQFKEFDVGHRMGAKDGILKIEPIAKYTLDWLIANY